MTFAAFKSTWRPAIGWSFAFFYFSISATVVAFMWLGYETLESSGNVIVALVGAGGGVAGVTAYGRSNEKIAGRSMSEYDYSDIPQPPTVSED